MESPRNKNNEQEDPYATKTFPVPFLIEKIKENIIVNTNIPSNSSKDQIINQGLKLHSQGNIKKAANYYRYYIDQGSEDYRLFSNYAAILQNLGNLKESELYTRKVIELKPNFAEAYSNLGIILRDLGNLKEADLYTRKAIELKPNFPYAYSNLGHILRDLGKLKEAELYTRKAIKLKPDFADFYFNLSLIELLNGNYESGLKHYEFRDKTTEPTDIFTQSKNKRVDNQKLEKGESILVVSEQAPGDVIMHMRYLIPLRNQGLNISFCAPEKLHSLIKDSGIHSHPLSPEQSNLVKEGQWIPLLSLLKYLSISPQNPPIDTPYISSTEILKEKWRNILCKEKRPIIGINWQGSKKMESTYLGRSIPLNKFAKIVEKNDISLISFQKGFGSEQMEKCSFKEHFVNCQDQIDEIWDYSETAAIIENCDLIITNDCSLGPLAAGIGKKVWLLLRDSPFWYWGLQGERTFWYPTMKLFRQKELHNWDEVIERVSTALQKEIRDKYKQDE